MRGKLGLIVGLGVGYVLGTRAGRARYEQIAEAAQKVWHLEPVQNQVEKIGDFAKSSALALPRALWNTAVKAQRAATAPGTASERVARGAAAVQDEAPTVAQAAKTTAEAATEAAADVVEKATKRTPKKR